MKKIFIALLVVIHSVIINAQSHYPGQHAGKFAMEDKLVPKLYSFDLQDVKLLDSRFKENIEREQQWLKSIPVKSLLHSFRTNAGVYSAGEGGYMVMKRLGGWESLDGISQLTIESARGVKTSLHIRYPSWATNGAIVKVNGKKVSVAQKPGSYIVLNRVWKDGDKIEINFPIPLRIIPTNDDPDKAAIAYGPIILAAPMGTEAMTSPAPYSDPKKYNDYYTYEYNVPAGLNTSLQLDKSKLNNAIKAVAGERLVFKTTKEGITLRPLYDIHRERYVVYWDLK